MPLHDWTDRSGWEGMHIFWMTEIARAPAASPCRPRTSEMHIFWMTEIARALRATLPPGYRAVIGSSPLLAVPTSEEDTTVMVEQNGRLIAAVELISPRNKDRPSAREEYAARYLNYVRGGVHLLLVDVHRRPIGFAFAQLVAANLGEALPAEPAPSAASYRVGAPAAQGGGCSACGNGS